MSGEVRKKFQMTNFTMPNNSCSMKYALKLVPGLADVGVPHGVEDGPRTTPRCVGRIWKKFQMTNFIIPNNSCSMKYALKSVPGLADVGVPHGVEDGPRTTPRCVGRVWKKFLMAKFYMPSNVSSMKHALKSVPGLASHGDGEWGWPQNSTLMSGGGLEKVSND